MTITELTDCLNKLKDHYGDIEVGNQYDFGFSSNFDIGVIQNSGSKVVILHFGNIVKLLPQR